MIHHPTTLVEVHETAWHLLAHAVADRKHPFHQPVLATVDNGTPQARVVVLRRVWAPPSPGSPTGSPPDRPSPDRPSPDRPGLDDARGALAVHTDVRSPKVQQLASQPVASWTFYDSSAGLQIRLLTRARVISRASLDQDPDAGRRAHDQATWARAWDHTRLFARRCYLAPHAPSSERPEPDPNMPESVRDREPTADESAPGLDTFAVVLATAHELDWLSLRHDGHRRARIRYADDGSWSGAWLAP